MTTTSHLDETSTSPGRGPLRRLSAVLALSGLALTAAACGGPPASEGAGPGREGAASGSELPECPLDALDEADGTVTVDLWFGGLGGSPTAVMTGMAEKFNASQDKIVVRANNQGTSYEEVLRKYQGASATPAQLPQIIYLEDTTLGEMVDKGQVLPAQSCMDADDYDITQIAPQARGAGSVDGVMYPGYMNVSTPVIFFNKVHFEAAGLDPNAAPKTLEEVREVAQILKDQGISSRPLSFVNKRWFVETWLAGIGQPSVDNNNGRSAPPTAATFNTPEAVELLEFLQEMESDGLVQPFANTEGSINHYLALLPSGDAQPVSSMLIETSTASSTIRDFLGGTLTAEDAGPQFSGTNIDLDSIKLVPGAGALPGISAPGKVFASGGNFFILNTSSPAQQAASWAFLKFMLQPENAYEWHTQAGYLPVVKEVLDNPDVEEFWETDVAGGMLRYAVEQLNDADPDQAGPLVGPYPDFAQAIDRALDNVLLAGRDPAAELEAAEASVTAVLERYNQD